MYIANYPGQESRNELPMKRLYKLVAQFVGQLVFDSLFYLLIVAQFVGQLVQGFNLSCGRHCCVTLGGHCQRPVKSTGSPVASIKFDLTNTFVLNKIFNVNMPVKARSEAVAPTDSIKDFQIGSANQHNSPQSLMVVVWQSQWPGCLESHLVESFEG